MAYAEATAVAFEKSISEIVGMVRKAGAGSIAQMEEPDSFVIGFKLADRLVKFTVRFPALETMPEFNGRRERLTTPQRQDRLEQKKRSLARALMLVIKAKLESVESGIETFEQAFLANVVMANGDTVYERIREPMQIEYDTTKPNLTLGLLPPPGESP